MRLRRWLRAGLRPLEAGARLRRCAALIRRLRRSRDRLRRLFAALAAENRRLRQERRAAAGDAMRASLALCARHADEVRRMPIAELGRRLEGHCALCCQEAIAALRRERKRG